MTIDFISREDAMIEILRARYLDDGCQFFAKPSRNLLPDFLGGYLPDAIAVRPDGSKIVIEVKTRPLPEGSDGLGKLAELLRDRPGWELMVVRAFAAEDDRPVEPSPSAALRAAGRDAEDLAAHGQIDAALLLGWSVLEGLARRLRPPRPRAISAAPTLVEWLVQEGHVSQETGRALLVLGRARNRAAHGHLMTEVSASDLAPLFAAIDEVAADVAAIRPADETPAGGDIPGH